MPMDEERKALVFVDLHKYTNKAVSVRLASGEDICGKLISYDQVPNIVLECNSGEKWRYGSKIICIGTNIMSIALGKAELKM